MVSVPARAEIRQQTHQEGIASAPRSAARKGDMLSEWGAKTSLAAGGSKRPCPERHDWGKPPRSMSH